jgi:hypothetical protein
MRRHLSLLPRTRRQRGAAALVVSLVLLFGMTLAAFFINRGMIFEQRTSANQYRATRAFEIAEAGLEWAVARLNDSANIAAAPGCGPGASTTRFADRYLPLDAGTPPAGFAAVAVGLPSCRISAAGVVSCECPAAGTHAAVGVASEPRFTVQFLTGAANGVPDPWSVRIVSRGCTNAGPYCNPGLSAATPPPDGVAVVSALYKMRPALPVGPGAGLVTGAATNLGGNFTVVNMDPKSNGITINAGSVVNLDGSTQAVTLPGTPPRASVLDNDPALRDLTNADATGELFFRSFMGEGFAEYQNGEDTWWITNASCGTRTRCTSCGSANVCGQAMSDAYDAGFQKFWVAAPDLAMRSSTRPAATSANPDRYFGTKARPLIVASEGHIEFTGSIVAHGLFYAATSTAVEDYVDPGTGTARIVGAIVSRSRFTKGTGTLDLIYDANLFNPGPVRGTMVRVPGSWRDSENEL